MPSTNIAPSGTKALPPIIIISFNRPHYLKPVLESLRDQTPDILDREIHLFQDGAINAYSGIEYAAQADLDACVELFHEVFPNGRAHISPANIGIAENFYRAEKFAFEELKADIAFFFEDDMVLSPHYVAALETIWETVRDEPLIGYFNAAGAHTLSQDEQRRNRHLLRTMGHKWAFGLRRDHWQNMLPRLAEYYRLVFGQDYKQRPHREIRRLFLKWGLAINETSQDIAKDCATLLLKKWSATTYPCLGKYIGEKGTHFTPKLYTELRYADTHLWSEPLDPPQLPPAEDICAIVDSLIKNAAAYHGNFLAEDRLSSPHALVPRMSAREITMLEQYYSSASRIVEYGCGGSTYVAATKTGAVICSVDSDPNWIQQLQANPDLSDALASGRLTLVHADIGPTGEWGKPTDESTRERWPAYHAAPWATMPDPDLIFVDGRFRLACLLSAVLHATPDTLIMVHDFWNRREYHPILPFMNAVASVDSLAVFRRKDPSNTERARQLLADTEYRWE